ncbi:protein of unknown function [Paraburkholderia dioscoreae]|uniref:Uncharacterized protein n=1 Tax=Paraburkholderia dioscoreae TaxID=2604047 RepID=A0A5Q4YVF2_9BURK|nr:protein of unknown function [Paraburkholderia dioscoreae]
MNRSEFDNAVTLRSIFPPYCKAKLHAFAVPGLDIINRLVRTKDIPSNIVRVLNCHVRLVLGKALSE